MLLVYENRDKGISVECKRAVHVNDFMSCHQTAHTNCHQIA